MKSILLIGAGHFGKHIAIKLHELRHQIMAVNISEERIQAVLPYVTRTQIGDSTDERFLRSLGIRNYDVCIVTIGDDFQNSLETVSLLKELGAKKVIARASRGVQEKFLLRNGADEVIYPEKDIAEECAVHYSMDNIFDYMEMADGYGIYEITPIPTWCEKSIRESNIAAKHRISILGIKKQDGTTNMMPSPDYVIKAEEHLMVLAKSSEIMPLLKKYEIVHKRKR